MLSAKHSEMFKKTSWCLGRVATLSLYGLAMIQGALAAASNNEVIIYSLEREDGSEVPLLHTIEDISRFYERAAQ